MALGQGIHDILKYKDIAEAGQPQNLTGEALVQLGALFTQMDFDFKKKEEVKAKGGFGEQYKRFGGGLEDYSKTLLDPFGFDKWK